MKRTYKAPKAMLVDFNYDEQVVAMSGNVSDYGDPQEIGRCQQSSPTSCKVFWNGSLLDSGICQMQPFSLRTSV